MARVKTIKDERGNLSVSLQKALKGFVPEFANMEDITIMTNLGKLAKLIQSVDQKVLRELEKKTNRQSGTSKMREILDKEKNLTFQINRRNNDF